MHSKTWCPMPFLSLTIHPTGRLTHCMMSETDMGAISDGWDNDKFQLLRQRMLDGKWSIIDTGDTKDQFSKDTESNPEIMKDVIYTDNGSCLNCFYKEQRGLQSQRQNWLRNQIKKFPEGTFEQANKIKGNDIYHLNLNLSNVCNFKCRMCSPAYSNSLIPEYKFMEKLNAPSREIGDLTPKQIVDVDLILDSYGSQLSNLRTIWVTGGEPFMDNRLVDFWEKLKRYCDTSKVNINITTNGSKINIETLKKLNHFGTLGINISVDATGQLFEYMRSAGQFTWAQMEKTIDDVIEYANTNSTGSHKIEVSYNAAYQIFNSYNTTEFIDYFNEKLNKYKYGWIEYRMLTSPRFLSVNNMPEHMKLEIKSNMEILANRLEGNTQRMITNCLKSLDTPRDEKYWHLFIKNTAAVDVYRKQKLEEYAPDIWKRMSPEDIKKYYHWEHNAKLHGYR